LSTQTPSDHTAWNPIELLAGESLSSQPLGETSVLVCYSCIPDVAVSGAYVQGEFVRAENFAEKLLQRWSFDIAEENGVYPQKEAA